jgi:hypothetical protein
MFVLKYPGIPVYEIGDLDVNVLAAVVWLNESVD